MHKLKRITTEYLDIEDRIRVTALTEDDKILVLWFTYRLMSRVVTHCVNLLEKHSPEVANTPTTDKQSRSSTQSFVQQSAQQNLYKEESVTAIENSHDYLIQEVDVKFAAENLTLIFKAESIENSELHLNNQALRQWLGIIFSIWKKADWPISLWPNWMDEASIEGPSSNIPVH